MPPAARITDMHMCPIHAGGPVVTGEVTVIIGNEPASRVTDRLVCAQITDIISAGEPSVIIGHKDAARMGDPTIHGGRIAKGCPTVLIGSSPQTETLKTDKPFCEECARKKEEMERRRQQGKS